MPIIEAILEARLNVIGLSDGAKTAVVYTLRVLPVISVSSSRFIENFKLLASKYFDCERLKPAGK